MVNFFFDRRGPSKNTEEGQKGILNHETDAQNIL